MERRVVLHVLEAGWRLENVELSILVLGECPGFCGFGLATSGRLFGSLGDGFLDGHDEG
jgi:hypothetical protein